MAIYEFFTSRNNGANVATFVGQAGRLFYDGTNGVLKLSDGITPGGANIQLPVATTTLLGGIKAGPGANVAVDGTLTIDTTGLPLSIGNLEILDTTIKTSQINRDLFLVSNGTGNVVLIGEVQFYKPNGFPPVGDPVFRVKNDGQLRILVPAEDPFEGGIEVIGSATGRYIAPGQPGAMIQMTGNPGVPARMYLDGNADYASFVARRYNGNVAVPTQVLANQDVFRINATAATTSGVGNVALAQIRLSALEDQTPTAQGSKITFTVTPIGSSAASRVDVANVTVEYGLGATKATIVGNVTAGGVSSTGTITASGNLSAANVNTGQITATGVATLVGVNSTGFINTTANISGAVVNAGTLNATGAITSGDGISDSLGLLRSIPQNSKNTGYTLQATDNGQMINITSGNVTIPGGVFNSPFGQTVSIYNNQNFSNTIVQGTNVTLRLAGTASTGNRTLARYGVATVICVAANTFVISGAGIT